MTNFKIGDLVHCPAFGEGYVLRASDTNVGIQFFGHGFVGFSIEYKEKAAKFINSSISYNITLLDKVLQLTERSYYNLGTSHIPKVAKIHKLPIGITIIEFNGDINILSTPDTATI